MNRLVVLVVLLLSSCTTPPPIACNPIRDDTGRIARNRAAVNDFARINPCPTTGKPSRSCPGYVIDHIKPLCNCGSDTPANMQWQTLPDSKIKDREERKLCAGTWSADLD